MRAERLLRATASLRPTALRALMAGLVLALGSVAAVADTAERPGNALRDHPSAYLAMHGDDPVAWRDFGPDALAEAQASNKPLYISSGYFSCHWCHVMQRESYRDTEIAALLNRHFIPVKLDRELHPAVDAYLIEFAERQRGQAGWPLNVFLTPEGHPFHAVLYLPPKEFAAAIDRAAALWATRGPEVAAVARKAAEEVLQSRASSAAGGDGSDPVDARALGSLLAAQASAAADALSGGFGHQLKFPMAPRLAALLVVQQQQPNTDLGAFLRLTLERMATQGLADLVGGGFFRYTVDPDWQTPHFEKMLYTQALLAALYLDAARVLDEPRYREVARRTLDFMLSEMLVDDGLFAASLSAVDADGVEGGYYLWQAEELAQVLPPPERALAALVWGLQGPARLDAGSLPTQRLSVQEAAERFGFEPKVATAQLAAATRRLAEARARRALPRDDKAITGWNGLALSALSAGAVALDDARYREAADRLYRALTPAWREDRLSRAKARGTWQGDAALEDYVYLAKGLTDYAAALGVPAAAELARELADHAWRLFRREGLWHDSAEPLLPQMPGQRLLTDVPLPAPDAMLIALMLKDSEWDRRRLADAALADIGDALLAEPLGAPSMIAVLLTAAPGAPLTRNGLH